MGSAGKDILQRVAAGDPSGVTACVEEYGDLVWRLASRYLGGATGEIEDAVQEVFVELWMAAGRFDPSKGSEASFVATIAHRRLTDYQRRVTSRSRTARNATPADADPSRSLADAARRPEAKEAAEAFDRLPDEEKRVLWLALRGGLTHAQIADSTGTPVGTVKSRLRRGLARLSAMLGGEPALAAREGGVA